MESQTLIINPKTKVLELLEAYPELEPKLIELVPSFNKLKNPLLRRTIARITSLSQAAIVGNIPLEKLINFLRNEIGQTTSQISETMEYTMLEPNWFSESKITKTLDARPMLEAGEHPVNIVISDLKGMNEDEIYELTAPFLPAPLIDKASSINFKHFVRQVSDQEFHIFFTKAK